MEQEILNTHELKVMDLVDRLGRLVEVPFQINPITGIDLLRKCIDHVEKCYRTIKGEFDESGREMDTYTLQIQEERNEDFKSELTKITGEVISIEVPADQEEKRASLERLLLSLKEDIRCLAGSKDETPTLTASGVTGMSGVQLPKIEVPTFDGNLLNWRMFWEQFESTIHSKTQLTESDNLAYLREALKESLAHYVVSGLMQTSESMLKKSRKRLP